MEKLILKMCVKSENCSESVFQSMKKNGFINSSLRTFFKRLSHVCIGLIVNNTTTWHLFPKNCIFLLMVPALYLIKGQSVDGTSDWETFIGYYLLRGSQISQCLWCQIHKHLSRSQCIIANAFSWMHNTF